MFLGDKVVGGGGQGIPRDSSVTVEVLEDSGKDMVGGFGLLMHTFHRTRRSFPVKIKTRRTFPSSSLHVVYLGVSLNGNLNRFSLLAPGTVFALADV